MTLPRDFGCLRRALVRRSRLAGPAPADIVTDSRKAGPGACLLL